MPWQARQASTVNGGPGDAAGRTAGAIRGAAACCPAVRGDGAPAPGGEVAWQPAIHTNATVARANNEGDEDDGTSARG